MRKKSLTPIATAAVMVLSLLVGMRRGAAKETEAPDSASKPASSENDRLIEQSSQSMIRAGRRVIRLDTFGSETISDDALQLRKAVASEKGDLTEYLTSL